jgi:hypothetical protein
VSTRIGTGFVVDTIDAARLAGMISSFRTSLAPQRLREHARLLAERTCAIVDRTVSFDKPWDGSPLSRAFGEIDDAGRESDARGTRAVFEDFGMGLSLIPDAVTGRTYGIIHCERSAWRRRWMRTSGVADFHYQDSADRPSGVTAREWAGRRDTWRRVMPSYVPAEHGFSATIFETRIRTAHDRPLTFQPSHHTRVVAVARETIMNERMADVGRDDIMQTLMREAAFLKGPEGLELVRERSRTVRLPLRITSAIANSRRRPEDSVLDIACVRDGLEEELDAGPPSR